MSKLFNSLARNTRGALFILAVVLGALLPAQGQAQTSANFNHASTGFNLEGTHARVACESCHRPGLPTKGVPRDCNGCHLQTGVRAGVARPPTHIPTPPAQQCVDCHNQNTFTSAVMKHTGDMAGQCARCHNGLQAPGKNATHFPTTASCDSCHIVANFTTRKAMVHDATSVGRCSTCHNGTTASGKSQRHIPTTAQCDTCHTSTVTWLTAQYLHDASTIGRCATCHNGQIARGRQPGHIPSSTQCDSCHTSQVSFTIRTMNHTGLNGQCSTCHSGAYLSQNAQMKPPTHIPTNAQCDTCHKSTTSWATTTFDHSTVPTAGVCSTCHTPGGAGLSKPTNHIPTTAQCDTCHKNFVAFRPATMDHTGTVGQCATCHSGGYTAARARAKPATHIPTGRTCDACHMNTVAFAPSTMDHTGLNGQCSTCHSGGYLAQNAQMKPITHIATSAQCDACHTGFISWATAKFDHSTVPTAGVCSTCHTPGGKGLSKPTNHIPTTAQCDSCHKNFAAFAPATMNHAGTAGQCVTCHNGSYLFAGAKKQNPTHIPSPRSCDVCHKNTVAFAPATMDHTGLNGQCSTCHNGSYLAQNAQAKPVTHIPTTAQCDTCHTGFVTWATATFDHASVPTAGLCSTCHFPGGRGLSKPTNHIPTTAQCDSCHKNTVRFSPTLVDHNLAGIAGQCSNCHNGAYLFAGAKRQNATHIPDARQCDSCHNITAFTQAIMNHAGTAGRCQTCHSGAYVAVRARGKLPTHIPTSMACDTCHLNTVVFAPANMNHTGTTGQCATCHSGAYLAQRAVAKPPTHIPTTAQCDTCHTGFTNWAAIFNHATATPPVAGRCDACHRTGGAGTPKPPSPPHVPTTAQCDTCHRSTASWATVTFAHPTDAGGRCSSCHFPGGTGLSKLPTHIPTNAQCDACHKNFVSFRPAAMDHTGTTGQCFTCHSGAYTSVRARAKPATHIPAGNACDTCHLNTVAFAPTNMNHTGTTGQCATCHSGAYLAQRAVAKPPTHIPTTAQCDTCHTGFTTWATTFNHATATPPVAGRCDACHRTGGAGTAKPPSPPHVPTTAQCDTCHRSTASWATVTFVHPPTAVGTCSTCHRVGGSGLSKPATHIPTNAQCDACHRNFVAFKPSGMDHTGTTGQCVTCHNGTYTAANARSKPLTHIPTSPPNQSCDACHQSTTAFAPTRMNHGAMGTTLCSTCHSGAYLAQNAQAKPLRHVVTTAQCNVCHTSFTTWRPATFNHTAVPTANVCATCHAPGGGGKFKPTNHIPTTRQCDSCHKNFVAFAPATMDHTIGTAGACSTCHNGAYLAQNAQAKHLGHIVTTAQCDTCHKGFITWATATFNHTGVTPPVAGRCSTCHVAGGSGSFKPANHIPTTAQCDSGCHSNTVFTAFTPAFVNHALPGIAGQCNSCHNGAYLFAGAKAKTATHIPDNRQCGVCHTTTAFKPSLKPMNHTGLVTCKNCHNGAYVVARAKPANHIPEAQLLGGAAMECSACHKSTTSWTPVGTTNMNHNNSQGNGSGWCKACHASGVSYLGAVTKKSLTHDKSGPTITDCSQSGCHRPLGNRGTAYRSW